MMRHLDAARFETAHSAYYPAALSEIINGKKRSCWMWFIFPQLKGLGRSPTAQLYALEDLEAAREFFDHPVLGQHLREITSALLQLESDDPRSVMGPPDDVKLKSSMTLFEAAAPECGLFAQVLDKYFSGKRDIRTLKMLGL